MRAQHAIGKTRPSRSWSTGDRNSVISGLKTPFAAEVALAKLKNSFGVEITLETPPACLPLIHPAKELQAQGRPEADRQPRGSGCWRCLLDAKFRPVQARGISSLRTSVFGGSDAERKNFFQLLRACVEAAPGTAACWPGEPTRWSRHEGYCCAGQRL